MTNDSLTVTDNRTGRTYELPVANDTINAMDLRQIKVNEDDFGMLSYDPGFKNTASTESTITYIDGDKGIVGRNQHRRQADIAFGRVTRYHSARGLPGRK